MQSPIRALLVAGFVALVAIAAISAPAMSALHLLEHAAVDAPAGGLDGAPDAPLGDAEPESSCDLCTALAHGRTAIDATAPALCLDETLGERLAPRPADPLCAAVPVESASPRAPPVR